MAGVFQRYSKEWISSISKYGSFGWKFSKGEIRVDLGLKTEPVHAIPKRKTAPGISSNSNGTV